MIVALVVVVLVVTLVAVFVVLVAVVAVAVVVVVVELVTVVVVLVVVVAVTVVDDVVVVVADVVVVVSWQIGGSLCVPARTTTSFVGWHVVQHVSEPLIPAGTAKPATSEFALKMQPSSSSQ